MSGGVDIFGGPLTGSFDPALAQGFQTVIGLLSQVAENTKKVDNAGKESKSTWDDITERARHAGEVYTYVVGTLRDIISTGGAAVTAIAALSSEQAHLSENSARLGLDFDEGAASFGRFADETEAMGVATQFAGRNIRLTQEELNALGRVAGTFSRDNMTTTRAAVDSLSDALLNGNERGLRQFGGGLERLGGPTHTVAERLAALTRHAQDVVPATDDASDALERYKDVLGDAERAGASAFTTELGRLASLHTDLDRASVDAQELNRDMTAVGQTAAHMAAVVGATVGTVLGTIATGVRGVVAELQGAYSILERMRNGASFTDAARGARAEFFGPGSAFAQVNNARETAIATLSGVWNDTGPANANTGAVHTAITDPNSMTFTDAEARAAERDADARNERERRPRRGGGRGHRRPSKNDADELARLSAERDLGDVRQSMADAASEKGSRQEALDAASLDDARSEMATASRNKANESSQLETAAADTARQNSIAGHLGAFDQGESAEERAAKGIKKAWEGASEALSTHLGLALSGAETWETAGAAMRDALKKTLGETLKHEGEAEFARALASFAGLNPALGALHIAAGTALTAVGSAISGGGGASPPAAGGGGAAGGGRAADLKPRDSAQQASGGNTTVVFGGDVYAMGNNRADAGAKLVGMIREATVQRGTVLPQVKPR